MKKILLGLLFISLIVPGLLQAAPISTRWSASYNSQSGIQPTDVEALELGVPTFGTVVDVSQLSKFGFKNTKVGDKVQITLMEGNKLKISIMTVKQEKIIQLKK